MVEPMLGTYVQLRTRVEAEAIKLGASQEAIYKWRKRGIPPIWQLKLIAGKKFSVGSLKKLAPPKKNQVAI